MGQNTSNIKTIFIYRPDNNTKIELIKNNDKYIWYVYHIKNKKHILISSREVDVKEDKNKDIGIMEYINISQLYSSYENIKKDKNLDIGFKEYIEKKIRDKKEEKDKIKKNIETEVKNEIYIGWYEDDYENKFFYKRTENNMYSRFGVYIKYIVKLDENTVKNFYVDKYPHYK